MKVVQYLKETRGELKHVNWPTRTQAAVFTTLVIALSLSVSLFLGAFDYLFSVVLRYLIE